MDITQKGYNLSKPLNNFTMFYDDVGVSDIPIIFIHGYPFNKSTWQGQLSFFENDLRCIAVDVRGFGQSDYHGKDLTIDKCSDDMVQFMDVMGIEKAIFCGLSMGGYIALNIATRYQDRTEALVLCNTQCIGDNIDVKAKRVKSMENIRSNGVSSFADDFVNNIFSEHTKKTNSQAIENIRSIINDNNGQELIHGLVALANRRETCSDLGHINVPSLIIGGKEDALISTTQTQNLHKGINGSLMYILEEAGHMSNIEKEKEFNEIVRDFLQINNYSRK